MSCMWACVRLGFRPYPVRFIKDPGQQKSAFYILLLQYTIPLSITVPDRLQYQVDGLLGDEEDVKSALREVLRGAATGASSAADEAVRVLVEAGRSAEAKARELICPRVSESAKAAARRDTRTMIGRQCIGNHGSDAGST